MSLFSLLYASTSTIACDELDTVMSELVEVSRAWNVAAGITGCLIFSAGRFAQVLEGDERAVEDLMRSIARDSRHKDVVILETEYISTRRFDGWALGYAGPSLFVHRSIALPMAAALHGSQRGISDLLGVMMELRTEQASSLPPSLPP